MDRPTLIVVSGGESGKAYPLEKEEFLIGRLPGCDLCLAGKKISRRHARIHHRLGLYWLEDLGSTNGTFLTLPQARPFKLAPRQPVLLMDQAVIQLGETLALKVQGVRTPADENARQAVQSLYEILCACERQMPSLDEEQREHLRAQLYAFQARVAQAQSPAELAQLAAGGLWQLNQTVIATFAAASGPPAKGAALPPLPDLPDPESSTYLPTVCNLFIKSVLRLCGIEEQEKKCNE